MELFKKDFFYSEIEFQILDKLFGDVDAYCGNSALFDPEFEIDEADLRLSVKQALNALEERAPLSAKNQHETHSQPSAIARNGLSVPTNLRRLQLRLRSCARDPQIRMFTLPLLVSNNRVYSSAARVDFNR